MGTDIEMISLCSVIGCHWERSCAGLSPSLEPLKIRGGVGDGPWPRLSASADPALCPVFVQSEAAAVSRYKVMIGAFLRVHRGDAELFKPPAAVRSRSPDTQRVCRHRLQNFVSCKTFFHEFRTPQLGHTPARGLYACVGEVPAVPALSCILHRHHDE